MLAVNALMVFKAKYIPVLLFLIGVFTNLNPISADILKQNTHARILFGESWEGAYILGFYGESLNLVRFEGCGGQLNTCSTIEEISFDEIEKYHDRVLLAFKQYRQQMSVELDRGFWSVVLSHEYQHDLKIIDFIIADIEKVGLKYWVFRRTENKDTLAPRFSMPFVYKGLVEELTRVLKQSSFVNPEV